MAEMDASLNNSYNSVNKENVNVYGCNADGKGEGNMNTVDEKTSPAITNTNTNMDVLLMGSWPVSILKTEEAVGPILILFTIKIKIVFSYHIRIILTPSIQSVELIQKSSSSVSRL
jgi:hypothetical protein